MKKKNDLRCIHRHTIKEHPKCFVKGLVNYKNDRQFEKETGLEWYNFPEYKIGYLDIETDNLYADFGTMLTWCIKDKGGIINYDVIKKEDLFAGNSDYNLVKNLLKKLQEYKIVITYYGCVTPGHKVLTSDLRWVNVETLKPGDELLAFEEKPTKRSRQYVKSTVINNIPIPKEVFRITLENGESLFSTGDHPWLVKRDNTWCWRKTTQLLNKGKRTKIHKLFNVWDESITKDAGYLAGFFDSEGGIYQAIRKDRGEEYTLSIWSSQNVIQNAGIVSKVIDAANRENISLNIGAYDKRNEHQNSISIAGTKVDKLEFLGKIRPDKIKNLNINKLGEIGNIGELEIISVESVGTMMVCGLETSSKTYIVNGFGSHNTGFDIPYIRSKALHYDMNFPSYGEMFHFDLYYVARDKLRLTRKSLSNVCDYLNIEGKSEIDKEVWRKAKYGDPLAIKEVLDHNMGDVVILEQLHDKLEFARKWTRRSI